MEQAEYLSVADLVTLDHRMRQDFACNLEWNWAEHHVENHHTIDRVLNKVKTNAMHYQPKSHSHTLSGFQKGSPPTSFSNNSNWENNSQENVQKKEGSKKKLTKEMV